MITQYTARLRNSLSHYLSYVIHWLTVALEDRTVDLDPTAEIHISVAVQTELLPVLNSGTAGFTALRPVTPS